jgi:hypothetical protein
VKDLEIYAPGIAAVIGTDNPSTFKGHSNVLAFKLNRSGILHCYHDKRFVIQRALTQFKTVIQIDADTRITASLPASIEPTSGLAAIQIENIVHHAQKYNPERLHYLYKLSNKLQLNLDRISFIGEALFAISANEAEAAEFIRQWDSIAHYLQLHKIHAGEGNAIGLAAAKATLTVLKPAWLDTINQARQHSHVSHAKSAAKQSLWEQLHRKLDYHYRFGKARIAALRNFNFYYR